MAALRASGARVIRLRELPPSFRDNDAPALTPPPRPYECTGNVARAVCGECGERTSTSLCDAKTPRGTCDMPMCDGCRYRASKKRDLCFEHRPVGAPAHNPGARVVPTGGGR